MRITKVVETAIGMVFNWGNSARDGRCPEEIDRKWLCKFATKEVKSRQKFVLSSKYFGYLCIFSSRKTYGSNVVSKFNSTSKISVRETCSLDSKDYNIRSNFKDITNGGIIWKDSDQNWNAFLESLVCISIDKTRSCRRESLVSSTWDLRPETWR